MSAGLLFFPTLSKAGADVPLAHRDGNSRLEVIKIKTIIPGSSASMFLCCKVHEDTITAMIADVLLKIVSVFIRMRLESHFKFAVSLSWSQKL